MSYLGCLFWPRGLAILYPHPSEGFSAREVFASAVILAVVSAGVFRLQAAGAVLARRLAVVSGNARPGDRSGAGRRADNGRSLHLPAADRPGAGAGLGRERCDRFPHRPTTRKPVPGCPGGGAAMRRASRFLLAFSAAGVIAALGRRRLAADGLLARQRNPLGPRHDVPEHRRPISIWDWRWPRPTITARRSGSTRPPWRLIPATRTRTTAWGRRMRPWATGRRAP